MVMEMLDHTHTTILGKKYDKLKRQRREGLLYMCHLTRIFKHFKVSFEEYPKVKVKESWFEKKTSLKNMKFIRLRTVETFSDCT